MSAVCFDAKEYKYKHLSKATDRLNTCESDRGGGASRTMSSIVI